VGNFQILIVSAVKIYKQCLQTASASGGLRSHTAYRGSWNHWGTSPDFLGYDKTVLKLHDFFIKCISQRLLIMTTTAIVTIIIADDDGDDDKLIITDEIFGEFYLME